MIVAPDLGENLLDALGFEVGDDHARTLPGEPQRRRRADPGASPGHHSGLADKAVVTHVSLLGSEMEQA